MRSSGDDRSPDRRHADLRAVRGRLDFRQVKDRNRFVLEAVIFVLLAAAALYLWLGTNG